MLLVGEVEAEGGVEFELVFKEGDFGFGNVSALIAASPQDEFETDGPLRELLIKLGGGGLKLSYLGCCSFGGGNEFDKGGEVERGRAEGSGDLGTEVSVEGEFAAKSGHLSF